MHLRWALLTFDLCERQALERLARLEDRLHASIGHLQGETVNCGPEYLSQSFRPTFVPLLLINSVRSTRSCAICARSASSMNWLSMDRCCSCLACCTNFCSSRMPSYERPEMETTLSQSRFCSMKASQRWRIVEDSAEPPSVAAALVYEWASSELVGRTSSSTTVGQYWCTTEQMLRNGMRSDALQSVSLADTHNGKAGAGSTHQTKASNRSRIWRIRPRLSG